MSINNPIHHSLTRRRFLMSLGASAPLILPILRAERVLAQSAAQKKFIYYHTLYGCPHDLFVKNGFDLTSEANFKKSDVLLPLLSHMNDINVVSGMRFHANNDRGGGHRQHASFLTGHPQRNSNKTPARGSDQPATHESIDYVINRHLGNNKLVSLGIGSDGMSFDALTWTPDAANNKDTGNSGTHFGKVTPIENPVDTYKTLFGGSLPVPEGMSQDELIASLARRGKVLQAVQNDLNSTKRFLSGSEAQKIEAHIASLDQILNDLDPDAVLKQSQCGFEEVTEAYTGGTLDGNLRENVTDLQIRMAVEALKCGIISTVTILVGASDGNRIRFTNKGSYNDELLTYTGNNKGWHWMSHHDNGQGDQDANRKTSHANIARWNANNLAKIVSGLKNAGIFDNSVAIWGSGLGNTSGRNSHTHDDIPFVMAGSLGGSFNTGKYFNLGNNTNQTSVLTAVGRAFGALNAGERFGHDSYAKEPFDGLMKK